MSKRNLFIYMDETGNTGLNHFDESQPYFILGAAIADSDLDIAIADELNSLKLILGTPELHASKAGLKGINKIAKGLINVIQRHNISFRFSVVEKKYHVAIMIFHLIYDPGINPAASNHGFLVRHLRLTLSYNFLSVIDGSIINDFWSSTQRNDVTLFISVLEKIKKRIQLSHLDSRSKELLLDALQYTIEFPDEIFNSMTFKKSVSSNISAFTAFFNSLHEQYGNKETIVPKVIHDEQKEFGHSIKQAFEVVSKIQIPTDARSLLTDATATDLLKKAILNLVPSTASSGVQLIDIALWIFKKTIFDEIHGVNKKLTSLILMNSHVSGNTFGFHEKSMIDGAQKVQEKYFSEEDLNKAKKMIAELDSKRWKRK